MMNLEASGMPATTVVAEERARYVGWAETHASADRVWALVGAPGRWAEWMPGVSWSGASEGREPSSTFHLVWRGRLLEGRIRERHAFSYLDCEFVDPRRGLAFDCCIALSRLPLGHTVAIAEMTFAPWLRDAVGDLNPCEELCAALRTAFQPT